MKEAIIESYKILSDLEIKKIEDDFGTDVFYDNWNDDKEDALKNEGSLLYFFSTDSNEKYLREYFKNFDDISFLRLECKDERID